MERRYKDGVDYWNIDVDFFENKKVRLIRGEFGIKGVYIYLMLLNEIYRNCGYYKKWDADDCLLMSDSSGVAGDCSPKLIEEVVSGCVRRSLFDERVYNMFGVLTSEEIQRRFLRMVGNSRDSIQIVQEYFLLDPSNRKDVTSSTSSKLTFFSVSSKESTQNLKVLDEKLKVLGKEQNRIEKKRKEHIGADKPPAHYRFVPPTVDEVRAYAKEKGYTEIDPDAFVDFYTSKNWMVGKNKMTNWRSAVAGWDRRQKERGGKEKKPFDYDCGDKGWSL